MTASPPNPATPPHPKVSVCVITYNQERYIRECLDSLIAQQTDFDFEIVVGDDCSTDGTRAIVEEFVERHPHLVRTHFQPSNTGGSRNNLEVHAAARGDYVAHMDGDDYALPGKLQAQADLLDRDATCNAVWHPVDFFDDEGGFCSGTTADLSSFGDGRVAFGDAIRLGYIGVYSSLMYRRSALTRVDAGRAILDLYFTWDTLSKGHGWLLRTVLGRYRVASTGSLQAASLRRVQLAALDHAGEFMARFPERRRDFLVWALSQAVLAVKNRQAIALDFVRFAWRARSWVGPGQVLANLLRLRRTRMKWRSQRGVPKPKTAQEA
jgi:glycosyltransferase involved in cell wall biosynthesis